VIDPISIGNNHLRASQAGYAVRLNRAVREKSCRGNSALPLNLKQTQL
jgi:hypothetical protein